MPYQQTIERKAVRTTTKFTGEVTCKGGASRGIVKDLSPAGICFQLYFDINATTGQEVSIQSDEFGHLTGIVHGTAATGSVSALMRPPTHQRKSRPITNISAE